MKIIYNDISNMYETKVAPFNAKLKNIFYVQIW